ncbi:mitochondrial protein C2orf69 homolog [Candoia aspera]|uniref:mitochondrial protein C2orf69 homolog n=1 Tax=Candoia aspera TaxID=51853 RepID=UPI002FD85988
MSRCCLSAASAVRGLLGSVFLCLTRTMSLRGSPAAYLSGASGSGRTGSEEGGSAFSLPSTSSPRPKLLRLSEVPGAEPFKANNVLLHLPLSAPGPGPPQHHVLYFPGDVQNYHEIMACHPENFQWKQWCLENVAIILGHRFPGSYIWIIKCSRMHLHKFSCYDNFVASNLFGAPEHSTDFGAFRHLHALLVNAFKLAQKFLLSQKSMYDFSDDTKAVSCELPTVATSNGCPAAERHSEHFSNSTVRFNEPSAIGRASFTLIGFSKGCVVLNQLLHELKEAKKDKDIDAFIQNIRAMYWLDGGHSGGSNTWVTYPHVLNDFSQTGISVNAHVTPYQVFDTMRTWIGKEHKRFVQLLEEFGVNINSQLHFADEAPSLDNHFKVHEVF